MSAAKTVVKVEGRFVGELGTQVRLGNCNECGHLPVPVVLATFETGETAQLCRQCLEETGWRP